MKKLFIVASFSFLFCLTIKTSAQETAKSLLQEKANSRIEKIIKLSPGITGLAAIDLTNGKTAFSFNSDMSFPQASAIKIPILMEVFKQANQGAFDLSSKRTIQPNEVVGGSGVIKNLKVPLTLGIRNISTLMIALSDNTATNAIIDLVGMQNVNNSLESLGLTKTLLQRKMMDIKASAKGKENLSTPAEAAAILKMLFNGEFINKKISSEIVSILKTPPKKDSRLATGIPDNVPIAFKFGNLNGVSTEWAIVLLSERPYAVAIMENYKIAGESPRVIEKISEVLYDYFWRMGNSTSYGVYRDPALIKG